MESLPTRHGTQDPETSAQRAWREVNATASTFRFYAPAVFVTLTASAGGVLLSANSSVPLQVLVALLGAGVAAVVFAFIVWLGLWVSAPVREAEIALLKDELHRLRRKPVPDRHRNGLLAFVAKVIYELEAEDPATLFWRYEGAPVDKDVAAHFPELSALVREWHTASERSDMAASALKDRLTVECDLRGVWAPPYDVFRVLATVLPILNSIAKNRRSPASFAFGWRTSEDPPPSIGATPAMVTVCTVRSAEPVAILPADPRDTLDARVKEITDRVEDLYQDAQLWEELDQVGATFDAELALRIRVLARAERDATREIIAMVPDCDICEINLGREPTEEVDDG